MSLYFNFWAPASTWTDAYDPGLIPAQEPENNEIFTYEIDYVEIRITSVPGDTDADRDVDMDDYQNLLAQFGFEPPAGPIDADFNDDGIVDLEDFAILRSNLDFASTPHPAPEPAMLFMIVAGAPVVLKRKRRS